MGSCCAVVNKTNVGIKEEQTEVGEIENPIHSANEKPQNINQKNTDLTKSFENKKDNTISKFEESHPNFPLLNKTTQNSLKLNKFLIKAIANKQVDIATIETKIKRSIIKLIPLKNKIER